MPKKKDDKNALVAVINENTEMVAVETLVYYPGNARQGDVEELKDLMRENGFFGTVIAQKSTRYILVGNHRYQAAVELGIKHLPVTWVDVDDERAAIINTSDNRGSDLASYDPGKQLAQLKKIFEARGDYKGTGYTPKDVQKVSDRLELLRNPPTKPVPPQRASGYVRCTCPHCEKEFTGKVDSNGNVAAIVAEDV